MMIIISMASVCSGVALVIAIRKPNACPIVIKKKEEEITADMFAVKKEDV